MTPQHFLEESARLGHAIQSAIAFKMSLPGYRAAEPKHMRVGIDTSKAEHAALVQCLVRAGIILEDDYFRVTLELLEHEVKLQTDEARRLAGVDNISFG